MPIPAKILSTQSLDFSTNGFMAIHRRIFTGIFKHAGQFRRHDISKREWVLDGDSVSYLNWEDLDKAMDYDLFAGHSWYFRNALVRASYKNAQKGIDYTPVYLERFFRNLLLGEGWDLFNHVIHVKNTC